MKPLKIFETKHNSKIDEIFHQLDLGNIGNVVYWSKFFEITKNVTGDIVECGIGRGRSMIILCALNYFYDKYEGGQRQIFGYDSFEGFPLPSIKDKSFRNSKKGDWSKSPSGKYEYSKEIIIKILKESHIPLNEINLTLTKGFFNESLLDHPDRPIAILHVDGDLYESHKSVLEILYEKVTSGGIIIFDDIMSKQEVEDPFPGSRIAVKEFFKEKYDLLKVSIGGTLYFIKE
jgi:O-methyltransferase